MNEDGKYLNDTERKNDQEKHFRMKHNRFIYLFIYAGVHNRF